MFRTGRVVRIGLAVVLVVALAYFGYVGMEASHRLVNRHTRNADCRTPAQLGIAYEAINYDIATDVEMAEREADMEDCSAQGAPAGDELVTSDGVSLAGWYVPAAAGVGPRGPTIVAVHGWTNNKSGVIEVLSVFHAEHNVVIFDLRNHGQSENSLTTQGIHEQRDVAAVLDWLVAAKGPETIVLWGESMGGHTAVNVAADDPRVDGLILDVTHSALTVPMANRIENDGYPFGQIGAMATVFGAWVRTSVNVLSDDPIVAITQLGDRPVLIVHGAQDDTIPLADADAMLAAALAAGADARLEVCEEAGHADVLETCPAEYQRWVDALMAEIPATD